MIRALAKGAVQFVFGWTPGGPRLYRTLTRDRMGTQATHVDKLARVWPGYVRVWVEQCGFDPHGKRLWIHEGGWTPFPFLAGYALTGQGVTVTNVEGRLLDRYALHALSTLRRLDIPYADDRVRGTITGLPDGLTSKELMDRVRGHLLEGIDPSHIDLPDGSMDLCHSGGTLEHYTVDELRGFLEESFRILKPGGIASHVFDHRDHLYHADKRIPFLWHLSLDEQRYRFLLGHPLGYHNRLLPCEVQALFEEAGFETICVRRRVLPSLEVAETTEDFNSALVGLDRTRLAPEFAHATDEDLRTAAAHYLFRKGC